MDHFRQRRADNEVDNAHRFIAEYKAGRLVFWRLITSLLNIIRQLSESNAALIKASEETIDSANEMHKELLSLRKEVTQLRRFKYQHTTNQAMDAEYLSDQDVLSYPTGVHYVYVIRDTDFTGHYKIGYSSNLSQRYRALTNELPMNLKAVVILRGGINLEKRLHQHFANKRIRREWFALDDADIAYIRSIANAAETIANGDAVGDDFVDNILEDFER